MNQQDLGTFLRPISKFPRRKIVETGGIQLKKSLEMKVERERERERQHIAAGRDQDLVRTPKE